MQLPPQTPPHGSCTVSHEGWVSSARLGECMSRCCPAWLLHEHNMHNTSRRSFILCACLQVAMQRPPDGLSSLLALLGAIFAVHPALGIDNELRCWPRFRQRSHPKGCNLLLCCQCAATLCAALSHWSAAELICLLAIGFIRCSIMLWACTGAAQVDTRKCIL